MLTYAVIVLSVLVLILLVRSVSNAQLDKLELKLGQKMLSNERQNGRLYSSIIDRMGSDRRNLHNHVESLRAKIHNLSDITRQADIQLLDVIDDLAEKSGYKVETEDREGQPEVPPATILVLKAIDKLEVKPKKTVTYKRK